ncbi:MAG: histidinol-phosphate transaminase [Halanaerobiales bacterium]|nr:histidinol-phosphate transaminase [Halanaerobiales bacterium]
MNPYWSKIAQEITPYQPGEQPVDMNYIKLNTNENPYPPSPAVLKALAVTADHKLRLYPEPSAVELRKVIAAYYQLVPDQVFLGNGSDEVLAFSFLAFFNPDDTIVFPDITYSFYPVYCSLFKAKHRLIELTEDFSLPHVDLLSGASQGFIIANPNAPTGRYLELERVEQLLKANQSRLIIIDEAYIDFGGESAVKLINQYANLLIIQTVSKARSLAGLRVGFALGQQGLIEGLTRIKNSFNSYTLDRLAIAGAIASFQDQDYFLTSRDRVIQTRERIVAALKKKGFQVIPSQANFIFISHQHHKAEQLFAQLKLQGILVRYFKQPRIENYLRVSIGTEQEMDTFLTVISALIKEGD